MFLLVRSAYETGYVILLSSRDGVFPQDLQRFEDCASGPAVPYGEPCCESVDFDHDGDVDHDNYLLFEACATGPAVMYGAAGLHENGSGGTG
jgi:hypothetical protein